MRFPLLLLLMLAMLLSACDSGPQLPRTAPEGFEIEWFEGGALGAESELIRITADSIYHEIWLNTKQTVRRLGHSPEAFATFYEELKTHQPLSYVKPNPPDVYSAGGQSIWLRWPSGTFFIANAADHLLPEEAAKFEQIGVFLRQHVADQLSGESREYRIGLMDTSPLDPIQQVHVFVERETAIYRKTEGTPLPQRLDTTLSLVPGPYVVQVSGERKSGSFWAQESFDFEGPMTGLEIEVYGVNVEFNKSTE